MDELAPSARLERLEDALDALREASAAGVPILVEGEKDEAALRHLGVPGPVVRMHAGVGLFARVEALARDHREAILLVDWDRTGGRIASRVREACGANGVRLDESHRRALALVAGGDVKTVEALDTFLATLRRTSA